MTFTVNFCTFLFFSSEICIKILRICAFTVTSSALSPPIGITRSYGYDCVLCSKSNDTDSYSNETLQTTTTTVKPTTPTAPTPKPILPVQTGVKAQEEEQSSGLTIFFSLLVIGMYISVRLNFVFNGPLAWIPPGGSEIIVHQCMENARFSNQEMLSLWLMQCT